MAIGALNGEKHTFMFDLESFFWVLFWICIHHNGPNDPERVVLKYEKWNYMDPESLAEMKSGTINGERHFLTTAHRFFTPYFQPLISCVNNLRKVVFRNDAVRGIPITGWRDVDGVVRSRVVYLAHETLCNDSSTA